MGMRLGIFEPGGEEKILTSRDSIHPKFHFADWNYIIICAEITKL
jgi:hypothetical protein